MLNVLLHTLAEAHAVKNRDRVHVHLGTAEVLGRIVLLGTDVVTPGGEAFAQIILENRTIAVRGDRFIIRRYSPVETLGGGEILDPLAVRIRRSDPQVLVLLKKLVTMDALPALAVKIASTGNEGLGWSQARAFAGVTADRLGALTGELEAVGALVRLGSGENARLFSSAALEAANSTALNHLADYHRRHPDQLGFTRAHLISELASRHHPFLVERVLDDLLRQGLIALEKSYLRLPEHSIMLGSGLEAVAAGIQRKLDEAGLSPPSFENLERVSRASQTDFIQVINTLLLRGSVVRLADGSLWAAQSLRGAWEIVHTAMAGGTGMTIGQLRDALGSPRRQAVTLLEHFDALGLTRRQDDLRRPGPKFDDPGNVLKTKNT
jgi:selenocysteine-specific elongation factor